MSNVTDLFWCDARDEQGSLLHAPDCNQRGCFVVQGKKQETNTGGKAKLPDDHRCTITCAFCGKRKRYEDKCYHKQRSSAKLETENTRTAHSAHTGEREPSGPGHRTRNTTHRASTPVNRSQVAQDTADATQQTARAHR